jgi:hypothetical protein
VVMSHTLCVFLESRELGRLPANHPFYCLVEEALHNIVQCPLIMLYMARNTLKHGTFPKEVGNQRVKEIMQYLQNVCPTVSGSDSPAMESTFVDIRAYSVCGEDPKIRKVARKHVYIQRRLVIAWMRAHLESTYPWANQGNVSHSTLFLSVHALFHFCRLFTFFIKLCLLRGLTTAVNLAFASDINGKDHTHDLPDLTFPPRSCSFEHFLSQWSNSWLVFERTPWSTAILPYSTSIQHIVLHSVYGQNLWVLSRRDKGRA